MKIQQKKLSQLNSSEKAQLEALIYRYYQSASPQFIANRLEKDHGYDIVMLKHRDLIQGVSFYHLIRHNGRFRGRPSYILHFGQAMKRSGYRGNIIWKLGTWYARKNVGWQFPLESVTGIASFISPKAFEHFTKLFPRVHFELKTEADAKVSHFVDDYFNRVRGMAIDYDSGFCFNSPDLKKEDITDDFERIYRAKNEAFNRLFVNQGIITKENERIYKMPRHITVVGIRRPLAIRLKRSLPRSFDLKIPARIS